MYLNHRIIIMIKEIKNFDCGWSPAYFCIDTKNFELISILWPSNSCADQEDFDFFNKIYNGLGVQKYLSYGYSFIKVSRAFNEVSFFKRIGNLYY